MRQRVPGVLRNGLLLACASAIVAVGTGSTHPVNAQQTPDTGATTTIATTIPAIWSAQVVATQDLSQLVNAKALTEIVVPPTPPPSTTTPSKRAVAKRKKRPGSAPTSTLVRLLPSTTAPGAPAGTAKKTQSAGTQAQPAAPGPTTTKGRQDDGANSAITGAEITSMDQALAKLRQCESGNRYNLNTGNGYYGAYQFALGTWRKLGFPGYPHEAAPAMQDEAARKLQAVLGWGQWPACSRRIGLR